MYIRVNVLYAFFSIFFMMWWGFGGYEKIASGIFLYLPIQIFIYCLIEFVSIYALLFWTEPFIRRKARNGFFFPWGVSVLIITIPQLGMYSQGYNSYLGLWCLCVVSFIAGEFAACCVKKAFQK